MRRSVRVTLSVAPALSMVLSGCATGDDEPTHQAVCVDEQTEQRVDDDECDDDGTRAGGGFLWYFLPIGRAFPAIGAPVTGGTRTAPPTTHVRGGLPPTAGQVSTATATRGTTVVRGGFGSSGGSGYGG